MFLEFSRSDLAQLETHLNESSPKLENRPASRALGWLLDIISAARLDPNIPNATISSMTLLSELDSMFIVRPPNAQGYFYCGATWRDRAALDSDVQSATGLGEEPFAALTRMAAELAEIICLSRNPVDMLVEHPETIGSYEFADRFSSEYLSDNPQGGWHVAKRLHDGAFVSVPRGLCFRSSAGDASLRAAINEGCGAGPDLDTALTHAIYELIERDAYCLWWHGGSTPRKLQLDPLGTTKLDAFCWRIRRHYSERQETFLDISSDIGIPVVAALSWDESGRDLVCGTAASFDLGQAATDAYREMCQLEFGRTLVRLKHERLSPTELSQHDFAVLELSRRVASEFVDVNEFDSLTPSDPNQRKRSFGKNAEKLNVAHLAEQLDILEVKYEPPVEGLSVVKLISPILQPGDPRVLTNRMREKLKCNSDPAEFAQRPLLL